MSSKEKGSRIKEIDNFTTLVTLDEKCSIRSPDFTIPPSSTTYSNKQIIQEFFKDISLAQSIPSIWEGQDRLLNYSSQNKFQNPEIEIPKLLSPIESVPVGNLHDMLQNSLSGIQSMTFDRHRKA